jgi:hypothetical protein
MHITHQVDGMAESGVMVVDAQIVVAVAMRRISELRDVRSLDTYDGGGSSVVEMYLRKQKLTY